MVCVAPLGKLGKVFLPPSRGSPVPGPKGWQVASWLESSPPSPCLTRHLCAGHNLHTQVEPLALYVYRRGLTPGLPWRYSHSFMQKKHKINYSTVWKGQQTCVPSAVRALQKEQLTRQCLSGKTSWGRWHNLAVTSRAEEIRLNPGSPHAAQPCSGHVLDPHALMLLTVSSSDSHCPSECGKFYQTTSRLK